MKPPLWRDDCVDEAIRAARERDIALTKQQIEHHRRVEAQLYFAEGRAAWAKAILPGSRG